MATLSDLNYIDSVAPLHRVRYEERLKMTILNNLDPGTLRKLIDHEVHIMPSLKEQALVCECLRVAPNIQAYGLVASPIDEGLELLTIGDISSNT